MQTQPTPHNNDLTNITAKESIPDPDSVKPPEGCMWISAKGRAEARRIINRAIISGEMPEGRHMEVLGFTSHNGKPVVQLLIVSPAEGLGGLAGAVVLYEISVFGWQPTVMMDAAELHRRADGAWQASVPIDDLRVLVEEKTDLSRDISARRFVLDRTNLAERKLDANCIPLMASALDFRNWLRAIPPEAMVEGLCFVGQRRAEGVKP